MFSLKTKLALLLGLLITIVLVTWVYAHQSYSVFNVSVPERERPNDVQSLATPTAVNTIPPAPTEISSNASTATNTNTGGTNCTYPLAYWLQNQDRIPPQILVNVSPNHENEVCVNYAQSQFCTRLGDTSTAPAVILKNQFLVVIMNYLSGADPSAVADTISDAYEWLHSTAETASVTASEAQAARNYAETLQSYNEGEIGPGACEIGVTPLTQRNLLTPSSTVGITLAAPTPTITSTPTASRTVVIVLPTATEEPEEEPEPTNTPIPPIAPPPTNTPPPPPTSTAGPLPTSTEAPTPTAVPEIETPTPLP